MNKTRAKVQSDETSRAGSNREKAESFYFVTDQADVPKIN